MKITSWRCRIVDGQGKAQLARKADYRPAWGNAMDERFAAAIEPDIDMPLELTPTYCSGVALAAVLDSDLHLIWYQSMPGPKGWRRTGSLWTVTPIPAVKPGRDKVDLAVMLSELALYRLVN